MALLFTPIQFTVQFLNNSLNKGYSVCDLPGGYKSTTFSPMLIPLLSMRAAAIFSALL